MKSFIKVITSKEFLIAVASYGGARLVIDAIAVANQIKTNKEIRQKLNSVMPNDEDAEVDIKTDLLS